MTWSLFDDKLHFIYIRNLYIAESSHLLMLLPWYLHWLKQRYIYLFKFVTKLDWSNMVHEE